MTQGEGNAFVLVLPNTELVYASKLAERLHILIEQAKWPKELKVAASFGVAEKQDELPLSFIERTAKAVKAATTQGGNAVVVATEHMVEFCGQ